MYVKFCSYTMVFWKSCTVEPVSSDHPKGFGNDRLPLNVRLVQNDHTAYNYNILTKFIKRVSSYSMLS